MLLLKIKISKFYENFEFFFIKFYNFEHLKKIFFYYFEFFFWKILKFYEIFVKYLKFYKMLQNFEILKSSPFLDDVETSNRPTEAHANSKIPYHLIIYNY